MERTGTTPRAASRTIGAHYQREFYKKHPEKRRQYRIKEAVKLLTSAGYTVQLPLNEARPQAINA